MLTMSYLNALRVAARQWHIAMLFVRANLTEARRVNRIATLTPFISVLVQAAALGFVYGRLLGISFGDYLPFLSIGLALWQALSSFIVVSGGYNDTINRHLTVTSLSPYTVHLAGLAETMVLLVAKLLAAFVVIAVVGKPLVLLRGLPIALAGVALKVEARIDGRDGGRLPVLSRDRNRLCRRRPPHRSSVVAAGIVFGALGHAGALAERATRQFTVDRRLQSAVARDRRHPHASAHGADALVVVCRGGRHGCCPGRHRPVDTSRKPLAHRFPLGRLMTKDATNQAPLSTVSLQSVSVEIPLRGVAHTQGHDARIVQRSSGLVIRALNNVNLDLQPGDRVGVLGSNGAGKTTLLRAIAGLLPIASGMLSRLLFAASTYKHADILLMDEWMGVSDRDFQEKAARRLHSLVDAHDILVIASHDRALLAQVTNQTLFLHNGEIRDHAG